MCGRVSAWLFGHLSHGFSNTSQRVERFLDVAFHAPSYMLRIARAFPALIYPLVFRWNFNHSTRLSTFPQAERQTFRGLTGTFSGVSNTMTIMNHAGHGLSNTISMDYRTPFYGVSDTFPWTNRHLAW